MQFIYLVRKLKFIRQLFIFSIQIFLNSVGTWLYMSTFISI